MPKAEDTPAECDYGCYTVEANNRVGRLRDQVVWLLKDSMITSQDELLNLVRPALRDIGQGATDTVVKEAFFTDIEQEIHFAGFEFDLLSIYGW